MAVCARNDEETENRASMSFLSQAENRDELFDTEVNSNNGNDPNAAEDKFENGVEPLVTQISATQRCQEIVNDQNFDTLFQDELQVQVKMEERSPLSISDESGFEESYRIGVDSTTITFSSLDNEEQRETGPQVN